MRPRVYIVARPQFDVDMFCAFLDATGTQWNRSSEATAAEELVEAAGRICYMSFGRRQSPKTNEEYIHHLIRMGHESVLEHVNWSFVIEGISRAFTHQLVRHRVGFAFSQLSQQYHDESETEFVEPLHLEQFPAAKAAWQHSIEVAHEAYRLIRDEITSQENGLDVGNRENVRLIRSIARSVLPNATETKILITANARAIRHFLRVRGSILGDTEMRIVAAEIFELVSKEAPVLFFDFHIDQLPDGLPIVMCSAAADFNK